MIKHCLLILTFLTCSLYSWAGYGILVNGNTLYLAEHKGMNSEEYDEYLAHVPVKSGDYCQFINTTSDDIWAGALNTYSVAGFKKNGNKYEITVTGCYDLYIQLKWGADRLYVGNGSNCGSGQTYYPYTPPPGGTKTVKLVLSDEWKVADAKYAAWIWGENITKQWTEFLSPVSEGNDTLQVEFNAEADSIDFVRFSPKTKEPSWEHKEGTASLVWGESKSRINYSSLVWTVEGWSGGTWYALPKSTETYGLNIDGEYFPGKKNVLQTEWLEYMLRGVELKAGQKIKVENGENHAQWVITKYANTSYDKFEIKDGAYVVTEDGKYDFYLKFIYENDEIYISKEGTYTTAVRDQCTDVMMQAFFNESYRDDAPGVGDDQYHLNLGNTKWATLTPQAEEIGRYFDLVWLPPSANGDGMGYHPKNYSDQNSNWGTREELETLIQALHDAGSKVIADIVINHCTGYTSWCDFPEFDFGEFGKFQPDASFICRNDEVNADWSKDKAGACWGTAKGSYDDGENWDGARDWSHDNVYVQTMFKAYLKWILKVMKYDGFRYDKGDGFNNWHHDNYNKAANPYIAFMESYNGDDRIIDEIEKANRNLMALDFQTKWRAFDGIAGFDYSKCQGSGLLGRGYAKYAVTFIESHDWFLRPDNENEFGGRGKSLTNELKDRLLQANAFLLGMPGVPCVFYPHWKKYKEELKPMIEARKLAGIHSESPVTDEQAETGGYQCTLRGKYGWMVLQLGNKTTHSGWGDPNYQLKAKGPGYAMWVNRTEPLAVEQTPCAAPQAEKIIRDGQLFILRDGKTYTLTGQQAK